MSSYCYTRLPDPCAWIRVLTLFGASYDSPLEASLENVAIGDKPKYEAISYSWGTTATQYTLELHENGQKYSLSITSSLDKALRRFRRISGSRVLWNDATCINQDDPAEKAHQVRRMRDIYAGAARVLIYLGEPDDSTPRAIKVLQRIHKAVSKKPANDCQGNLDRRTDKKPLNVADLCQRESLKAFFRRPWFRRKWIIQECILASEAVLHCGEWTCEWDWFATVVQAIYDNGLPIIDYTTSSTEEEALELQKGISQMKSIMDCKDRMRRKMNIRLLELGYRFQTSEATDRRDHLYALLGLATDSDDQQLNPDYKNASILDSCLRYAHHFLRRYNNLEVLYRAGLTGHKLLAPSWIPNWYGNPQPFGFEPNQGVWNPLQRPSHLHAARGTSVEFVQTSDPIVLALNGVIIDEINKLANENLALAHELWYSKDLMLDQKGDHLRQSDHIMAGLETYPSGESLEDVQWRTLICNTTSNLERAPPEYKTSYEAWRRITLNTFTPQSWEEDRIKQRAFRQAIDSCNADKWFGLTKNGFVGMFPHFARKDDLIAILHGGEFPFVLRRCGESSTAPFELVGQCYVHGLMEENQLDLGSSKHPKRVILLTGDFDRNPQDRTA